jgi:hypothetical protein
LHPYGNVKKKEEEGKGRKELGYWEPVQEV